MKTQHPWQFWIDVGGTFTDCIGRAPDGSLRRHKLLSSGITAGTISAGSTRDGIVDPHRRHDPVNFWAGCRLRVLETTGHNVSEAVVQSFEKDSGTLRLASPLAAPPKIGISYELVSDKEAPIIAIRYLLGLPFGSEIPPVSVRLGTTRGTNALLERRGARTAFITTRGFGDVLKIGYQNRPKLFELNIRKPEPLYEAVVEIDERIAADGVILIAPKLDKIREQLVAIHKTGIESLAICLLHAYNHPAHEQLVANVAREVGFREISISHQVAPLEKLVPRGDTTVVDAYLNPVLRRYVEALAKQLPQSELRLLTSAGGLVSALHFSGKDSILSGPAGGVVGFSRVAEACGFKQAIGFDMGGTSTDVARFDGHYEREYETEKAGVRIVAPMMAIETVAAGGGSICRFDGVKLVVGPESAGAHPGPACYGRGGSLTVTDANLLLGRVVPDRFPFPLDRAASELRARELINQIESSTGRRYGIPDLAEGFIRIANANMAAAIRSISIAKGFDPRDYVLVAFGGAAAQHACAVAEELGIEQILVHPDAGLLSAYGAGLADVERHRAVGVYRTLNDETLQQVEQEFVVMEKEVVSEITSEGIAAERIDVKPSLDLRYQGTEAFLSIEQPPDGDHAACFVAEHRRRYGYVQEGKALEVVAARVAGRGKSAETIELSKSAEQKRNANWPEMVADGRAKSIEAVFQARVYPTPVVDRDILASGDTFDGPSIICDPTSTTVVEPGWTGELLSGREMVLRRVATPSAALQSNAISSTSQPSLPTSADPIQLEIFNNHFTAIATQMGITLRNTASSVNVKERLDFSCAIFTAQGDLVVNAPHVPVHLGAMSETVRSIIADNSKIRPGDVFVTNDPYRGGSHLPDVTVITPVHDSASNEILFFTASRAHHAEIGGITPGSMPPFSRTLADEGVLIRNLKLIDAGQSRFETLEELLRSGAFPSRDVRTNLADVAAQVAANAQGARDLVALAERVSWPLLQAYMAFIQQAAEQKLRQALTKLPQGEHRFVDHLDDGSPIAVCLTIKNDSMTVDFNGTGIVLATNLNANRAITTSAILYVLRLLIAEDIPLNQGVLAPVKIILPECLLNPTSHERPEDCAAVVGGNVETSQRVVDVLLGALGLAAASQGTMNNLLFGDETFGYYETICGGSGATATAYGADAIHTHMTNTRLTDPEVLERRYPVRLKEFSIRQNSGGAGDHRGGNGVIRKIEFLRELQVSILSQRRGPYAPYGLQKGEPGALGQQFLMRPDGTQLALPGITHFTAYEGDILTIETPGGGGYG